MPALRLLGTPTLARDDGSPIEGAAVQRHRIALLALLARIPGGCTRDKLVALLWPESPTDRARSSLSESIYVLRRTLGDAVLLTSGDDVRLAPDLLRVDVAAFDQALAGGEPAKAVEVYRGPFMDGFFLARSGEFERWVARERDQLAARFRAALEGLATHAERRRDFVAAIPFWRRLVTDTPLDARLTMRLMESLVAAGNRFAALEHARIHAALAGDEAGLPADPRVEALAQRIRDGWIPDRTDLDEQSTDAVAAPAEESDRLARIRPRRRSVWPAYVALAAAALVVLLGSAAIVRRQHAVARPTDAGAVQSSGRVATRIPPLALALYDRGRSHLGHHRETDVRQAIAQLDSAVAIESGFAKAHAGLAIAAAEMHLRFASVNEAPAWGRRAVEEARVALQLDSALAEAHEALAAVHRKSEFDWEGTILESRRALALDPRAAQPWFYMAGALYHLGLLPEAEHAVDKGLTAQPSVDRTEALRTLGTIAIAEGHYTEAASLLQDVQRSSDRPVSDTHLATAYFYAGERDRAEKLLEPLTQSRSASAAARAEASLASFTAARGDRGRARTLLAQAERGMVDHHVAYSIGVTYAQLRDLPSAVRWLRTAAETGFRCYPWYTRDPLLAPVRRDSTYRAFEAELRQQWKEDRVRFAR